jgi:hypothetical protein
MRMMFLSLVLLLAGCGEGLVDHNSVSGVSVPPDAGDGGDDAGCLDDHGGRDAGPDAGCDGGDS